MIFKLINDKQEYEFLALSLIDEFDSIGEWLDFFDIWKYKDEKYDEIYNWDEFLHNELMENNFSIDYSPSTSEYPVVLAYVFEREYDRNGNTVAQIWDWESLNKMKSDNEYSIGVTK